MKFPFVRQHDAMMCGPACLSMICNFFGKNLSQDYFGELCSATSEGVSLLGISKAAKSIGLDNESAIISLDVLQDIPLPALLHWNQNHFVVLYRIHKNHYYIADPGKGHIKLSSEEFKSHWLSKPDKGVVMIFEPTDKFKEIKDERTSKNSFNFLYSYISNYKSYFLQIFLGLLLATLLQLILPFLTQAIVDSGIRYKNLHLIWLILLGELMIVFGRTATDFIRRWLLLHISMRINISLLSDFFIKLLKLPMSFFDSKQFGDLMQRMNDHDRVQSFLTQQSLNILFTIISFVVFGVVLCVYNYLVFLIFLTGSIIYAIWIAFFLKRRKIIDYEMFEQQAINQNRTYEFLTTMQEIKLQDCQKRRRWLWEDCQADLFAIQMKSLKLQQQQEAGSVFINEIKNILITVFAATAVINGSLSLGGMLAIQFIVGQLNSPVEQLMQFLYSLQDVQISLERINEIHTRNNENDNKNNIRSFENDKSIEIRNIVFSYDKYSPVKTIDDISLVIPEAKTTAIVGASGSGKTTLVKLLLGYYPVANGKIIISGKEIDEYDPDWWRKQCGVVMQDGVIFSESIERNIAVDDNNIDYDKLYKAADLANIKTFIESLPLKYNTVIGRDGMNLSQGQKQRILIARAIYKNPSFIFLDEATNSLDANNEREIVKNMNDAFKGKTVVVVAHRLSTVKEADKIVVIDKGRIVESGTHKDLIKKHGYYYNLVKNQLELGL